ncbi:MAG: ATP-dependent helicase [Deltaproteobacteria bacterium]|nr:ATP-dependent helicase [Deltaproteobacteria bacterium]
MEELNEGQKSVCNSTSKHVLVIAGPGTGKTYSIAKRIESLVKQGVEPSSIISITFTNRAALELKERIKSSIGESYKEIFIGTIHKLGLRIIKDFTGREIDVIDREGQLSLLKEILKDERKAKFELKRIQKKKNQMLFQETDHIYEEYQKRLKERELYDYEDLILRPPEILWKIHWKTKIKHIIVDEFQDLNPAQYVFISELAKIHSSSICAVGDADQSIYGFRGSDVRIFLFFEKDHPDCDILRLTENYRSTRAIIEASTSLIKNNKNRLENPLVARRDGGPLIKVITVSHPWAAGDFIVEEIENKMGGLSSLSALRTDSKNAKKDLSFSDFAVIYRTHEDAAFLKGSFESSGIPYQIIGGRFSKEGAVLREFLSEIKMLLLKSGYREENPVHARQFLHKYPFIKEKYPALSELIQEIYYDIPIHEALPDLYLLTPSDDYNPKSDTVTLTTIHRVKGLEFSCVFIVGLDDGSIPMNRKKDFDIEEERRLLYVGMTRAKDELFLIHSQNKRESPFLREIPPYLIERIVKVKTKKPKKVGLFD